MEIISFTGKSGTGKSYSAQRICRDYNIEAIIDDGLLIYKGGIAAGRSAKECTSKAAAMRTALFNYEDHRIEVMTRLRELNPNRLMIIGTSDRMVNWISDALELPRASRHLYIENFTSEEDRKVAKDHRLKAGEHAIPVPMGQLKRDFAGYVLNPVKFFRNLSFHEEEQEDGRERTVVRPPFSYFGKFEISEQAIRDIIDIAAEDHRGCIRVMNFYHNGNVSNFNVVIEVRIRKFPGAGRHCILFQREVYCVMQSMTSFSLGHINIKVRDVSIRHFDRERKRDRI